MPYQLTVRAEGVDGMRTWELDDWSVDVIFAVLNVEPETVGDLDEALRRYLPDHADHANHANHANHASHASHASHSSHSNHELLEAGRVIHDIAEAVAANEEWCLVDLVGRTAVAGNGFEHPDRDNAAYGSQPKMGEDYSDGFPTLWVNPPADWEFVGDASGWKAIVEARAAARAAAARVDVRAVLWGQPVFEFIAQRVAGSVAENGLPKNDDEQYARTMEIHAVWLMTQRDDLRGRTPRSWILSEHQRIADDLWARADQWSLQGFAPTAVPRDCAAYRYGAFGLAEIVLYFTVLRTVLEHAWVLVRSGRGLSARELQRRAEEWMDAPYEEDGVTPRALIDNERRRIPQPSEPDECDDDCPMCASMGAGCGPGFAWFCGSTVEIDGVYAFSLHESYEEWETDQADLKASLERAKEREKEPDVEGRADDSVWKSTYVDWERFTPKMAKAMLSWPLAELQLELKSMDGGPHHINALAESLMEYVESSDPVVSRAAAARFQSELESVANAYFDLTARCADLQSRVDEILRRGATV